MLQEFKEFIDKGGVFEVAVGLIMALAFAPVVQSLVDDIIMPIVGAVVGKPDFNDISIHWGDATTFDDQGRQLYDGGTIFIGTFITIVLSFIILAFVVFLLVKAYNNMKKKDEVEESGPTDTELLVEIRDALRTR